MRSQKTELLRVWFTQIQPPTPAPSPSKSEWVGSDTVRNQLGLTRPCPPFSRGEGTSWARLRWVRGGSSPEKPGTGSARPVLFRSSVWGVFRMQPHCRYPTQACEGLDGVRATAGACALPGAPSPRLRR